MPSKEQTHSSDKSTAKRRPPLHEIQDSETVDWLHHPATIVRRAALAPGSLTPADVLRLQRTVGNRAVLRLSGVGGPPSEPEAGPVRAGPLGQRGPVAGIQGIVQRQEEEEEPLQMKALQRQELEEEEEPLQAKASVQRAGLEGGPVPPEVESAINSARGGGQPLDGAVQKQMGETMGFDFSGVRVHTDAEADDLSEQLQAKAFATGRDIFFKRGTYDPASSSGQELITHELTHVVQQVSGRVSAGSSGMTVRPAGERIEQEAEHKTRGAARVDTGEAGQGGPPDRQLRRETAWKQRAARAPVHAEPAWRIRGKVEGAVVQRNGVEPPELERQGHVTEEAVAATQIRRIVGQGAEAAADPVGELGRLKLKLGDLTSNEEQIARVTNVITGFAFAASIATPVQNLSDRFAQRQTLLIAKKLDESIYLDPKTGKFPGLLCRGREGGAELACGEESIRSFLQEGSAVAGQKLAEYSGDANVYEQYVLDKLDNDEKAYERRVNAAGQAPRLAQKKEVALSSTVSSLLSSKGVTTLKDIVQGCYYLKQGEIPTEAELTDNVHAALEHYNALAEDSGKSRIEPEGVEAEVKACYE